MFSKIFHLLIASLMCFQCVNAFADCIQGDCINGTGTFVYQSGNKYIGEWKNGKFHGQGKAIGADGKFHEGRFIDGNIDNSSNKDISKSVKIKHDSSIQPIGDIVRYDNMNANKKQYKNCMEEFSEALEALGRSSGYDAEAKERVDAIVMKCF